MYTMYFLIMAVIGLWLFGAASGLTEKLLLALKKNPEHGLGAILTGPSRWNVWAISLGILIVALVVALATRGQFYPSFAWLILLIMYLAGVAAKEPRRRDS